MITDHNTQERKRVILTGKARPHILREVMKAITPQDKTSLLTQDMFAGRCQEDFKRIQIIKQTKHRNDTVIC